MDIFSLSSARLDTEVQDIWSFKISYQVDPVSPGRVILMGNQITHIFRFMNSERLIQNITECTCSLWVSPIMLESKILLEFLSFCPVVCVQNFDSTPLLWLFHYWSSLKRLRNWRAQHTRLLFLAAWFILLCPLCVLCPQSTSVQSICKFWDVNDTLLRKIDP